MAENDDLKNVMKEETARGRRPVDTAEKNRIERIQRAIVKAWREKDERAFLTALREAGMKDGTPEFARALAAFRATCGRASP